MIKWVIRKDSNWLIICELCGKSFNKLGSHLRMTEKIRTSEYRKQFWLMSRVRLMSDESIEKARQRNLENKELVVNKNLLKYWVGTRFKKWSKGRTRDMLSEQWLRRLQRKEIYINY